jgi:diguanylate cyclase (GGDEF)-like protein
MTQGLRRSLREFQDYAEDVQRSGFQTFVDALKRLLSVLDATTPMGSLAIRVLPQADFDAWYQAALTQTGGMGGRGSLSWPTTNADRVALQLELLRRVGDDRLDLWKFSHTFLTISGKYDDMVHELSSHVVHPFVRDLLRLLHTQPEMAESDESPKPASTGGNIGIERGVDAGPKAISELPGQDALRADIVSQLSGQIALLFIDLDNFKSVNDKNGHQAGDRCLASAVEAIGGCIGGKGTLYRYGGDEFVVLLQNADADEGTATGERIRRSIGAVRPGGDIDVTASIGVAASDQQGIRNCESLISAADMAAYTSKDKGKNHVTRWVDGAAEIRSVSRADRLKRLIELAEWGVHNIQNDPQTQGTADLAAKCQAWEEDVLNDLAEAGALQTEISTFRVIGTYVSKNLPGRNVDYAKIVNEAAEKIARLRDIIWHIEERSHRR